MGCIESIYRELPIECYMYFVSLISHDFLNTNQILIKMDTATLVQISEEVVVFVLEMEIVQGLEFCDMRMRFSIIIPISTSYIQSFVASNDEVTIGKYLVPTYELQVSLCVNWFCLNPSLYLAYGPCQVSFKTFKF